MITIDDIDFASLGNGVIDGSRYNFCLEYNYFHTPKILKQLLQKKILEHFFNYLMFLDSRNS